MKTEGETTDPDVLKFLEEAKAGRYAGFELTEIEKAFDAIKDKRNWKYPIEASIPEADLPLYTAAVAFYTGSNLEVVRKKKNGELQVTAVGYYAAVGA